MQKQKKKKSSDQYLDMHSLVNRLRQRLRTFVRALSQWFVAVVVAAFVSWRGGTDIFQTVRRVVPSRTGHGCADQRRRGHVRVRGWSLRK